MLLRVLMVMPETAVLAVMGALLVTALPVRLALL